MNYVFYQKKNYEDGCKNALVCGEDNLTQEFGFKANDEENIWDSQGSLFMIDETGKKLPVTLILISSNMGDLK